jgi:hypothetical protein
MKDGKALEEMTNAEYFAEMARLKASRRNLELEAVDEDLRAYFLEDEAGRYVTFLPITIQYLRLARRWLAVEEGRYAQECAGHGKGAEQDVQPEKLAGQAGGGAFVAVDALHEVLKKDGGKGALDLILAGRLGMRVLAQCVDDLVQRHVHVAGGGAHGGESGPGAGGLASGKEEA